MVVLGLGPPEARLRRSFCRLNADLCRDPEQLGAIVLAGYRVGYDIIQVTCSKSPIHELSRDLEGLIEGLPGFELDQGQNSELIMLGRVGSSSPSRTLYPHPSARASP